MLVQFIGYAKDRRLIGYVECGEERLTDLLNRCESVVVRETFVERYNEDTISNLGDGEVDRALLYAVEAGGGKVDASRRIQTIRHRLQVQLGPYTALGNLHSQPGQMPLPHLHARGPMIPLSDATIGYAGRGGLLMRDVGTLIVNREMLDWVRADESDASAFPGVTVLTNRA